MGGLLGGGGGGGAKGMLPPSQIIGGGPLPTPVSPLPNCNIASPILFLPPLDPTRWSNLARAFYVIR